MSTKTEDILTVGDGSLILFEKRKMAESALGDHLIDFVDSVL